MKAPRHERIDSLDALRGVAVLGIFAINILGYGLGEIAFSNPILTGGEGWLNDGLWSFSYVFLEGSMRGLFSLLFGAGVVLFTARAAFPDGPIRVADLYFRRTLILIVIGLLHSYLLLGPGDILMIYGIAGLILFPFRILPPKTLAVLGLALMVLLTLLSLDEELIESGLAQQAAGIEASVAAFGEPPSAEDQALLDEWQETLASNWPTAEALEAQRALRTGDVATVFASNADWVVENSGFIGMAWYVVDGMLMMFLGMAFYKWGVLTNERSLSFYLRLAVVGYTVGLGLRTFWMISRWQVEFSPVLWAWASFEQVARVAVTMGHIGAFFCLWKLASSSRVLQGLAATGRMALSNYLGQTIIANLLFSGVGLGLYMQLTMTELYGTMLLVWVAQILFSVWWLRRYQFGPFEWAWRSLTYGKAATLRRR